MTMTTPLGDILSRRIALAGPINVAEYMTECLLHPEHGYYTTQTPFGVTGDFTTAPEISQMFGELIGLCLAQGWLDQGAPTTFTLAELGPGRGTLMADILRATQNVPGFHAAAQVTLLEASAKLRQQQAQALPKSVIWIDSLDDLPQAPLYVVANEFFDALPIRQFVRDGDQWRERQVGLDQHGLSFGLGPKQPQPALQTRLEDTKEGDLVEQCPAAAPVMSELGARIADHGGMGLIIDYGDWRSLGDTLQAVASHTPQDPLANPGQADLTAHVDFEALVTSLPCAFSRLTPQGMFLERLGITQRAQTLAQGLKGDALETHIAAHRRLTHPDEMGSLFKVVGLHPHAAASPPGFEHEP